MLLGSLVLLVSVVSPLGEISDRFFSAHMVQHEILILVAAPLFAFSRPFDVLRLLLHRGVLPRPVLSRSLWLRRAARFVTTPIVAWSSFAAMLWVWHFPVFYEAALANAPLHFLQHVSLFGSALGFWWNVTGSSTGKPLAFSTGVFYLLTTALHTGLLGALFSIAPAPVYVVYVATAVSTSWGALLDQQLAGLLLWVVGTAAFVVAACTLFVVWLDTMESRVRERERQAKLQEQLLLIATEKHLPSSTSLSPRL